MNARTFEICRAAGVDMDAIARAAVSPADGSCVQWVTKLGGRVLGRLPFERQGEECLRFTPTPHHTDAHMDALIEALQEVWGRLGLKAAA